MNTVNIINAQRKISLPEGYKDAVKNAVDATLVHEDIYFDCEVTVKFVSDKAIKELNKNFRDVNEPTDVLSFPSGALETGEECEEPVYLGDIAISTEFSFCQAEEGGRPFLRDIILLTAHSTLHLLGYDHATKAEEKVMFDIQDEVTAKVYGDGEE